MAETRLVVIDTISHPGITIIAINPPQRKNAVDSWTAKCLYNAILGFEADAMQMVCILTGVNGTFCAGADLHQVAQKHDGVPRD